MNPANLKSKDIKSVYKMLIIAVTIIILFVLGASVKIQFNNIKLYVAPYSAINTNKEVSEK